MLISINNLFLFLFFSMYLNTCYEHQSLQPQRMKELHFITVTPALLQSVSHHLSVHFPVASRVWVFFLLFNLICFRVFHRVKDKKKKEACSLSSDTKERRRWKMVYNVTHCLIKVLLSDHMTTWWQHCVSCVS